ncbi:hypothetical protein PMIT1327_01082 [Prochlorococcus marinus str. MIT 1327]|nr:hypothetical protein PMIT1312_00684 [Prochlorococcus marinus str. MIT 1312]KZR81572.1 hypothetical protein PMIT1327_01082 [Prochlorococcus marinus str. MIT 1327]
MNNVQVDKLNEKNEYLFVVLLCLFYKPNFGTIPPMPIR